MSKSIGRFAEVINPAGSRLGIGSAVENEMTIGHGVCHHIVAIMDRLVAKGAASLEFLTIGRGSIG